MIKYTLKQYKNSRSSIFRKWLAYPVIEETLDLNALAKHMASHSSPYSEGVVRGVLTDMVKCIRELTLSGITIKIPDLALFSCSVESSPAANPGKLKAALVENGGQVKNVKLLAQSTGEFTRSELNKDARFKFTSLTQSVIDEWNEEHGTDPEPEP